VGVVVGPVVVAEDVGVDDDVMMSRGVYDVEVVVVMMRGFAACRVCRLCAVR
jgi:hypothetical protein